MTSSDVVSLRQTYTPLFVVKSLVKDRWGAGANYGGVDAWLHVACAVEDDVCGCAEVVPA